MPHKNSNKLNRKPSWLAASLLLAGTIILPLNAFAQGTPSVGGQGMAPTLKSGNYCTSGASAQVIINSNYTFVGIKGAHPDKRRVAGAAKNGFSGEGFSIRPVSKKYIQIDQSRYGVSRKFKRC